MFSSEADGTRIECGELRSWVQIPPGPFLTVRELWYCFELVLGGCPTKPLARRECELKAIYTNLTGHTVQ